MNDGFVTSEPVEVVAALLYLFGEDCVTRIVRDEYRGQTFHIDAPSEDCKLYVLEFHAGTLTISDLKQYTRIYSNTIRQLKTMQRNGEMEYTSPSWIAGRGR
jgi:hypothetical protein